MPFQRKNLGNQKKHQRREKDWKKRLLSKLVYVHEGKERGATGRVKLKNPPYFASLYEDADDLWNEVLDYLEEHYDLEKVKQLFLCGDGVSWIKKGLSIIPRTTFVLDRFHLEKRLKGALLKNPHTEKQLRKALEEGNWKKGETILQDLLLYLSHNWEGILNYQRYLDLGLGVSAEGHVSHILSARLSSRPMGWSKEGADRMSYLRAMKFNGQSVRHFYLSNHHQKLPPLALSQEVLQEEQERKRETFREIYNNLPVMREPVSLLRTTLKELSQSLNWVPVV